MNAGEKLTQNVNKAAQDASIRGNLQPGQGKQCVLDFKTHPSTL